MTSIWSELKRRNVVRVAVAYGVVAWLLIEITSTIFPILRLPEWTSTFITVLLIIGFPLVVIFSWAYEVTPEGIKKEKEVDRNKSITHRTGRKLDVIIIGVLTVGVVYLISEKFFWSDDVVVQPQMEASSEATTTAAKSIAVLPFVNMSADLDQEYFSDGITEEILNALAAIQELAVTSRTSAFAFKGKNVSIPEIAKELGVAHVLEGSVRKSGTRLRITAQLIDVATDKHLWSETYDRELTDIFAMQDEISGHIATALKVNLLGDSVSDSSSRAVDPEAYDMYLHGLQQMRLNTYSSLAAAEKFFRKAIDIDPLFVRAYAGLGWTLDAQIGTGSAPFNDTVPRIREVLRQGIEIDPENAGLVGLTGQLNMATGEPEKARDEFRRALALDPPHFGAWEGYADALYALGRQGESIQVAKDWLATDPLNPKANIRMAFIFGGLGDYSAVFATTSRLKSIVPDSPYGHGLAGIFRIAGLGDLTTGIPDLERSAKIDPDDPDVMLFLALAYFSIGEMELADAWVAKARKIAPDITLVKATVAYSHLLHGDTRAAREVSLDTLTNNPDMRRWWGGFMIARYAIDELIDRREAPRAVDLLLQIEPEWNRLTAQSFAEAQQELANPVWIATGTTTAEGLADLARALRAAGKEKDAENVLSHIEAILAYNREPGFVISETLDAELHMLRGRNDDALDALERSEKDKKIYFRWQFDLVHNRIFDRIRDHPRFVALLDRIKAEMERQRTDLRNKRRSNNQIPL